MAQAGKAITSFRSKGAINLLARVRQVRTQGGNYNPCILLMRELFKTWSTTICISTSTLPQHNQLYHNPQYKPKPVGD